MTKYSTGRSSSTDSGTTCELCGSESETLQDVNIAGAELSVCGSCAPHDDRGPSKASGGSDRDENQRRRRAAQHAASVSDARKGDPDHWVEEGTSYESDPLPYLVSAYGKRLETARQEAGLTREELADELAITLQELEAIEQNRAARAGVGGSAIKDLETFLDITLTESG